MPETQLFVTNRQGQPLGELANARLDSVKWVLNDSGQLSYTLSQDDPLISLPELNVNEISLKIDGQQAFQGINQKCKNQPASGQFTCPGILEYFKGFYVLHGSLFYPPEAFDETGNQVDPLPPGMDQLDIAADLVRFKQDEQLPDTERYIQVANYTPSGKLRYRRYWRNEHAQIFTLLQDFTKLANAVGDHTGFDYDIVVYGDGRREWTPYYPIKGTFNVDVILEWGRNVIDFTVDEDGSSLANYTYCTGGSNGDIKFENNARDAVSATKYGQWEDVISDASENDVGTLLEMAQKNNFRYKDPIIDPQVTAVEVPDKMLGVLNTGDLVWVRIQRGRVNINNWQRIVSLEWKPGAETLTIGFLEKDKT